MKYLNNASYLDSLFTDEMLIALFVIFYVLPALVIIAALIVLWTSNRSHKRRNTIALTLGVGVTLPFAQLIFFDPLSFTTTIVAAIWLLLYYSYTRANLRIVQKNKSKK